ncbi:MAG: glycosyltransferase family 2 protein [Verrucomicrobia bacterium]|nr:glycosyltransferase family 2 protein [Verrucomicrobiota bacterium]
MSARLPEIPKIAVIVLNWNGKNDTLACLESLEILTYPNFETIVVDNGSTDNSVPAICARFPRHIVIQTGSNLGFAVGNNIGMKKAIEGGADLLLLLNNDTIAAPDLLERFVETFKSHPDAGILGAKIYLFNNRDTLDHLGGMWNRKTGTFEFVGLREKDDRRQWELPQELDYVCGACLIVRRSVVEAIGYLEPRYFLIWEESDFCFRARKAGFKTITSPQAKIWHKVSASIVGGKPHSTYFWWRNRLLWIERNCPPSEKWSLYLRVIIPDVLHMVKIRLLKKFQIFLTKLLTLKSDVKEKELKLLKNRAALCGVRDYFFRRFGNGPSWIYKKHD